MPPVSGSVDWVNTRPAEAIERANVPARMDQIRLLKHTRGAKSGPVQASAPRKNITVTWPKATPTRALSRRREGPALHRAPAVRRSPTPIRASRYRRSRPSVTTRPTCRRATPTLCSAQAHRLRRDRKPRDTIKTSPSILSADRHPIGIRTRANRAQIALESESDILLGGRRATVLKSGRQNSQ
jgi:hypothetical protein